MWGEEKEEEENGGTEKGGRWEEEEEGGQMAEVMPGRKGQDGRRLFSVSVCGRNGRNHNALHSVSHMHILSFQESLHHP